jgi:hypothetical protein
MVQIFLLDVSCLEKLDLFPLLNMKISHIRIELYCSYVEQDAVGYIVWLLVLSFTVSSPYF